MYVWLKDTFFKWNIYVECMWVATHMLTHGLGFLLQKNIIYHIEILYIMCRHVIWYSFVEFLWRDLSCVHRVGRRALHVHQTLTQTTCYSKASVCPPAQLPLVVPRSQLSFSGICAMSCDSLWHLSTRCLPNKDAVFDIRRNCVCGFLKIHRLFPPPREVLSV